MKRERLASRLTPKQWLPKLRPKGRPGIEVTLPVLVLLAFGAYFGIDNYREHEREKTAYNPIERVGSIRALALQSDDPHKIHLATDQGLVRGYHDREWSRVGVLEHDLEALAAHPQEPLTFLAGGHDKRGPLGLARTTDGGFTWSTLALDGVDVHEIALTPADPTRIWAYGDGALRRSDDAGKTWTELDAPRDIEALAASPTDAQVLYAATPQGIHRSADAGETWTRQSTLIATSLAVHPSRNETLLAGGDTDARSSDDDGRTWRPLLLDNDAAILGLAIDPDAPSTYYAATARGTLYKTELGGTRWEQAWPE